MTQDARRNININDQIALFSNAKMTQEKKVYLRSSEKRFDHQRETVLSEMAGCGLGTTTAPRANLMSGFLGLEWGSSSWSYSRVRRK